MSHRIASCLLGLVIVLLPTLASAYSVVLRWSDENDAGIAGYHVIVRPAGADERPPVDVARPRRDDRGQYQATIGDLDVATTYVFALSAYDANGRELGRSNERSIGYAQAAAVVDSDHDGRTDAQEDVNLNLLNDAGETDRTIADTDGDLVPDGIEVGYGADPLTPGSPDCAPLDFNHFRVTGRGTAAVGYDPEIDDLALATTAAGRRATAIGVTYPREGKGALTDPLVVTRLRDNDPFRIEIKARSTAGRLYRLRYDGHGAIERITKRRLRRNLGKHFTGDAYQSIGIDVGAELAAMDPGAELAAIERISVRGSLVMQQLRVCR